MTSATDRYHHGNLPNALRAAAAEVIGERGLAGFSLREVARRAGVSHNAPAHHFGDVRGLLTSLATEGFAALHAATSAATVGIDDPVERLTAIGVAYVELARSHPAHCAVMFRVDLIDGDDESFTTVALQAYGVLEGSVQALLDGEGLDVGLDDAVRLCWSAMQGIVVLQPKFEVLAEVHGTPVPDTRSLVREFVATIVAGLRARSSAAPTA